MVLLRLASLRPVLSVMKRAGVSAPSDRNSNTKNSADVSGLAATSTASNENVLVSRAPSSWNSNTENGADTAGLVETNTASNENVLMS